MGQYAKRQSTAEGSQGTGVQGKKSKLHHIVASHHELSCVLPEPKYIGGLLSSAATRRLDHLRAEEKMIQREREAEGDEFSDKDAFVTQAYRDQMAEVRRAEEEEKRREGMD